MRVSKYKCRIEFSLHIIRHLVIKLISSNCISVDSLLSVVGLAKDTDTAEFMLACSLIKGRLIVDIIKGTDSS